MTVKQTLLQLFMSEDSEKYSDEEVKELLHSETFLNILPYAKFHNQQLEIFENSPLIKKLILLRIFSFEIWDEICKSEYGHEKVFERRINVIGKLYNRMMVNLDENICMLEKGYGISMISNQRLMLECYAISKYIWEQGEKEAVRFQDYADAQLMKIDGVNPNKFFKEKYKRDFYQPNGWISDKNIKTLGQLVDFLEWPEYKKMYKFASEFVHASPESTEMVSKLNRQKETDDFAYFPLGFEHQVELNVYIIQDFTELIINCFMPEDEHQLNIFLLKAITKWM